MMIIIYVIIYTDYIYILSYTCIYYGIHIYLNIIICINVRNRSIILEEPSQSDL